MTFFPLYTGFTFYCDIPLSTWRCRKITPNRKTILRFPGLNHTVILGEQEAFKNHLFFHYKFVLIGIQNTIFVCTRFYYSLKKAGSREDPEKDPAAASWRRGVLSQQGRCYCRAPGVLRGPDPRSCLHGLLSQIKLHLCPYLYSF